MEYVVILEEGPKSWGAYVPDLPGCVVAGETKAEALELIREAIEFHLEGLKEDGDPIPQPHSSIETIQVSAA
ncbi:MAG: type II toxin-antitoxin system HicB family antitoxin [Wenzhouxiangella sp.]|jgi:predicted RNase H-like HicB family nuclease|nr:type II toxin-antitoxin system HicB family antitoxin [Wenzhouxiangella sp.]